MPQISETHIADEEQYIPLVSGNMVIMRPQTQSNWSHSPPSVLIQETGWNGESPPRVTADVNLSQEDAKPPSKSTKNTSPGMLCEVRNLYQSKPDARGRMSWSTKIPDDLIDPLESSEAAQYALIIRHIKCYNGHKSLQIHSIVVQSALIKKVLGVVLKDYPGVTTSLEQVEFKSPFRPFVHRWTEFVMARDNEPDPETRKHVDLLFNLLDEELRDTIRSKEDLIANGAITHNLIWTIFEPGDIIFGLQDGRERAYKFSRGETNCRTGEYELTSIYVDFDGSEFCYRSHSSSVPGFEDTLPITSLPVFPLRFHPDASAIKKRLIVRGRLWEEHKGYHYKHYQGIAFGTLMGRPVKSTVDSRIIIDTEAFNTFNPNEAVSASSSILGSLDDDQLLLATPILRGHSLKDKRWLEFYLDGVKEIVWDNQAFDSLVLPMEQKNIKQLILALANSQAKHYDNFDDVIRGKGRGMIMLLSGPPGVGKTLTAESVAEVMKAPLYVMSAGDSGTEAARVEGVLKNLLRMIPKWGALLLLDEADVFLEARSSSDLARNELVSIFLRLFEYYEGILFLTTNRVENIDSAFESRIHVSIQYADLDVTSRRHIWSTFLGRVANKAVFSDEELVKLAEVQLNGRQIKNILRTAHLLATDQDTELRFEHVDTVLKLRATN
ncbi:hypothetical protein VTN00DRAFT_3305 [Thermoascus crustaceus]|uniref:uncharacterized protein n=1 Tax=Thermoascus crustaceus TaxID=5088 RepID=UPI003743B8BF